MSASSTIRQPLGGGPLRLGRSLSGLGLDRRSRLLAGICVVVMVGTSLEIVIDSADGSSPLVPFSPDLAGWLSHIGEPLGFRIFLIALLGFTGAYLGLMALQRQLSTRLVVGLVIVLQVIVSAGPVLLSTDVFSYLAYARMGIVHGINPYLHGPRTIHFDPIFEFVGSDWRKAKTAYGPLYTLISYPIALLGVSGSVWGMKVITLLSSLGTLALTWRCAVLRGLDPKRAILIVGLNPLWVIYSLGGDHNDLIMTVFMMAGVLLALNRREGAAAASIVAGAMIKATAGVLLPFMLLGSDLRQHGPVQRPRRWAIIGGAVLAALAIGALGVALFGREGINLIGALNRDSALVSTDAFPNDFAHMIGKAGVYPADHALLKGVLAIVVLYILWLTWRGYDWVAASGWTLLAIVVSSTWILPWYIIWSLPLAVVTRERRLLIATLAIQLLFIIHQLPPLFAHPTPTA